MPRETVNFDDLARIHAALAIEHDCGVADIHRELSWKASRKNAGKINHRAIYKLISNNEAESRVICTVRVIMPADYDAYAQKWNSVNGGILRTLRDNCPTIYNRGAPETNGPFTIAEAKYHYNRIKTGGIMSIFHSVNDFDASLCVAIILLVVIWVFSCYKLFA